MEVLKRLAPNYWAGYYGVYIAVFAYLSFVFREQLGKWPETESLFVAAAIFAVSTGAALLTAAITEGVGYVVLLIPRRIKQIKEEGRKEGFWEGFQAGRESRKPQVDDEEPASIETIIAWYNSGGITIDELKTILTQRLNGGEAD